MLVQAGLCRTCSETTWLVFPRGGSNDVFDKVLNILPFLKRIVCQSALCDCNLLVKDDSATSGKHVCVMYTPLHTQTGVCRGIHVPIFLIFAPKHRLWVLSEAVLMCTHNLYFEQK